MIRALRFLAWIMVGYILGSWRGHDAGRQSAMAELGAYNRALDEIETETLGTP